MTTKPPWAVLAYTIADDRSGGTSLDATVKNELRALCDAADLSAVSVAAQVDFTRLGGVFRGAITTPAGKSRDFEEVRDEEHPLWRKILGGVQRADVRVLKEQQDLNAARSGVLRDFLEFGRTSCAAERYVIFFYGHAYGPMGLFYDADVGRHQASTLRLNDLADSLDQAGSRAAVIVFRDCFMGTLEGAFQLRTVGEFMIATQALAPVTGIWPWLNFMAALMPGAESADVARALAMQLGHFLSVPENRSPFADVPYSLLDLDAVSHVAEPLKALTDALDQARNDPGCVSAYAKALEAARVGNPADPKNPGDPALIDVVTMCDQLANLVDHPVAGPASALGTMLREQVVRWHHSMNDRYHGTSLFYRPVRSIDIEHSYILSCDEAEAAKDAEYYRTLALCVATGWDRVALSPLPV